MQGCECQIPIVEAECAAHINGFGQSMVYESVYLGVL